MTILFSHRRLKLGLLHLQDKHPDFWIVCAGREDDGCSAKTKTKQAGKSLIDLTVMQFTTFLLQMAELDQVSFRSGRRVAPFKSCPDISVASGSDTGCIETGGLSKSR